MMPVVAHEGGDAYRHAASVLCDFLREEGIGARLEDGVLLAFSGGGDSVLLFHLLYDYTQKHGIPFAAAHIHHGLRGEEADRDAAFCKEMTDRFGVPFFLVHEDVPRYLEEHGRGMGTEAAARTLRYAALERLLSENPAYAVCATAHHATDNLETLLLHLVRGSGLRGMAGIPPIRGRFVRPMLSLTRREIMSALAEIGAAYVTDSTNASTDYDRNYIRAEILPRLAHLRPDPERAAARLSANLREELALGESLCDRFFAEHVKGDRVERAPFLGLPAPVRARVLARLCLEAGATAMPERVHALAAYDLLAGTRTVGRCDLPGGVVLSCDRRSFSVCRRAAFSQEPYRIPLSEGENALPDERGAIFLFSDGKAALAFEEENRNIYNLFIHTMIPFATISGGLHARTLKNGDAYRMGGMTRRVRRLLSSLHLPPSLRTVYPIVCDGAGVLWVPGFGVRDAALAENKKSGALYAYFCYQRKE